MNIQTMESNDIALTNKIEEAILECEQVPVETLHTIHSGIYTRTIHIPAGTVVAGAFIKIPTTLIATGNLRVTIGSKVVNIKGTRVITAKANRKQVAFALEDSSVIMCFATKAKTVKEAEKEFTDDWARLMSNTNSNLINITGE